MREKKIVWISLEQGWTGQDHARCGLVHGPGTGEREADIKYLCRYLQYRTGLTRTMLVVGEYTDQVQERERRI